MIGKAPWVPRDSAGEVTFNGKMYLLGGWVDSYKPVLRSVWRTTDGRDWERLTNEAPWDHADLSASLVFKERMWLIGGWADGRLPRARASNQVWSSTDGIVWQSSAAPWTARVGVAAVSFKGRLWIFGGTERYYGDDPRSLRNDVWSSADGRTWRLETKQAQWSPRAFHQVAVLNERIYLMGGGNYQPKAFARNDVWSSADGKIWRQETSSAPWPARIWFTAISDGKKIAVIDGRHFHDPTSTIERFRVSWLNHKPHDLADVWISENGKNWKRVASEVKRPPRHEASVWLHDGKLWIAGGTNNETADPVKSDVWVRPW